MFEALSPLEAARITGSRRYTNYSGYGRTFQCAGRYQPRSNTDETHGIFSIPSVSNSRESIDYIMSQQQHSYVRILCVVLAIDALKFGSNRTSQYSPEAILRETNKVHLGLAPDDFTLSFPVSGSNTSSATRMPFGTGNWGCGAFGGDAQLKALLQWAACSEADRDMIYHSFNNSEVKDAKQVLNKIFEHGVLVEGQPKKTVGALWRCLLSLFLTKDLKQDGVFGTIIRRCPTQADLNYKKTILEYT